MENKLTAAFTAGKLALATPLAIFAGLELSGNFQAFLEFQGMLVVTNVIFGIAATCYQHKWDWEKVIWDTVRNLGLIVMGGLVWIGSARGMVPGIDKGSAAGDYVATIVVLLLLLQFLQLLKALGTSLGPLGPIIDNLSARVSPDNKTSSIGISKENLAKGGPLTDGQL